MVGRSSPLASVAEFNRRSDLESGGLSRTYCRSRGLPAQFQLGLRRRGSFFSLQSLGSRQVVALAIGRTEACIHSLLLAREVKLR
jgi:hypothetical protein